MTKLAANASIDATSIERIFLIVSPSFAYWEASSR
jgi:hypothetical protein